MSLKGRLFLVIVEKMCSRSTHYIAFVANVIVNTFIMLMSRPYPRLGKERGRGTGLLNLLFGHWWAHFNKQSI